jgi:zinc protease
MVKDIDAGKRYLIMLFLFGLGLVLGAGGCDTTGGKIEGEGKGAAIEIPYEKFVLDNGLTLIVHEDHKAPIVAVNVWYHIGSKNEKTGKTGFAHLFEHLMFNGSEHYNDDYFKPLEKVGATSLNGTTNRDRTNYFQTVPTSALDVALWMESDRMGHLIGVVTQERLDEQRGVVQNEKRQGENRPYGKVWPLVAENTYPAEHPYSWTVIGSMEDLSAASLEDVHEWFGDYYGAANAVISIAGDVDTARIKKKVEEYFGEIPSGPPVGHQQVWIAKRSGKHRQQIEDRVPQAMFMMVMNTPQWGSADAHYLEMAATILGGGKTSRLYKRLVYEDQIATSASAYVYSGEIGGQFSIRAMAPPGKDLVKIEAAINEELERLLEEGPTAKELQLVKTSFESWFIRGIEQIGGFGGKSDILAKNEVYGGSADFYKVQMRRVREATTEDIRRVCRKWLDDGIYILEVLPFGKYQTATSSVDRSGLPEVGDTPDAKFPELERATLSNGLDVILAQRHSVPVVTFDLIIRAGSAVEPIAGTAEMTLDMMDEGTKGRNSLQISEELAMLGARIGLGAGSDTSTAYLSALKSNLDESLEIYADVILNPSFPEADFKRLQKQRLAGIQQQKSNPNSMGRRVIGMLLYGAEHPYGIIETEEAVEKITTQDLKKFHAGWLKPNNATLVIVGDTTLREIVPKLDKLFAGWKEGEVEKIAIEKVGHPAQASVYLMDRPDAEQSVLFAAQLIGPKSSPDDIAMATVVDILGGMFTSRINMNLREDKHWTYGARIRVVGTAGQRPMFASGGVQTDKTAESLAEVLKEYREIVADRPPSEEELRKVQNNETLGLTGRWETMGAVSGSIRQIVTYGLGDDYFQNYADKVRNLTVSQTGATAKKVLIPERLIWLVVGDLAKIEPAIRELNLARVQIIDVDGNIQHQGR